MTWEEYRDWQRNGRREGTIDCAGLGTAGETGEVCDLIKKFEHHQRTDIPREQMLEELGDDFFYKTWIMDHYGFTLDEVIASNVRKLETRYPDGFVKGGGIR